VRALRTRDGGGGSGSGGISISACDDATCRWPTEARRIDPNLPKPDCDGAKAERAENTPDPLFLSVRSFECEVNAGPDCSSRAEQIFFSHVHGYFRKESTGVTTHNTR
jgi:hypothetical protein